jgi:hypothetical protein
MLQWKTTSGALRPWVTVLLLAVSIGLLVGFTITWVTLQQRKICGLIVLLDDRNQTLPPATDTETVTFRRELHHYRQDLGC